MRSGDLRARSVRGVRAWRRRAGFERVDCQNDAGLAKVFAVILNAVFLDRGLIMRIYPVLAEASFNCEKSGRETFLPDVGQRSRAIIPGDDPGDQQPSEDASTAKKGRCQDGGAMEGVGLF